MQVSESHGATGSRAALVHKLPILFFVAWVLCELFPSIVSSCLDDDEYWAVYFLSEDISTVVLSLTFYFSLSYTSTILKGVGLLAVTTSAMILFANTAVEYSAIPHSATTGLIVAGVIFSSFVFLSRFIFKVRRGNNIAPKRDRIYLIVNKPHSLMGLFGVLYSGVGGGFSAYVNGDCYWFSREQRQLVKTHDPDWCKGRYLIDCGPATGGKINDLESMIGQEWSIFNNCFTVFSRWRRKWV